jgi:hypothetical protein
MILVPFSSLFGCALSLSSVFVVAAVVDSCKDNHLPPVNGEKLFFSKEIWEST